MIYEVDIDYLSELHDLHNDFLLAPHGIKVTYDMYSNYQKGFLERLEDRAFINTPTKILSSTFYSLEKYIVHSTLLSYYIEKG